MSDAKPMPKWLERILPDQNIKSLSELVNVILTGPRKFFLSQEIKPYVNIGYYNSTTGKYVLGQPQPTFGTDSSVNTITDVNTTSQATHNLTCPANKAYKVKGLIVTNATRTHFWVVTYTPNGGDAATIFENGGGLGAATHYALIGTGGYTGVANSGTGFNQPIWLQSGDVILASNSGFTAGDAMEMAFIYEEYDV